MSTNEIVSSTVPDALSASGATVVDTDGTPWSMKPLHITVDGTPQTEVVGYDVTAGYVVVRKAPSTWTADDIILAKHTGDDPLAVVHGTVAVTLGS